MIAPKEKEILTLLTDIVGIGKALRLVSTIKKHEIFAQIYRNSLEREDSIARNHLFTELLTSDYLDLMDTVTKLVAHLHKASPKPKPTFKFGDRVQMTNGYGKALKNPPVYGTYISMHSHNPDAPLAQRSIRHFILEDGQSEPLRYKSTDFIAASPDCA